MGVSKDLTIDYAGWRTPKPQGISACIRLRNEGQFMSPAVRSFLPYVDEVVLVTQPSDDDTEAQAQALVDAHPDKVRVCHYPLVVDWIDTPGFYAKDTEAPGHLVHMSNWALSQCRYSWILKVEGDVLATSRMGYLSEFVRLTQAEYYFGLVILNVAGDAINQISYENVRNGGWDEAFFPNDPDACHFVRSQKWEVAVSSVPRVCLGWSLLHLKRCKVGNTEGWNGENYLPWTRDNVAWACQNYNATRGAYPAKDDPLGQADWLYETTELTEARC